MDGWSFPGCCTMGCAPSVSGIALKYVFLVLSAVLTVRGFHCDLNSMLFVLCILRVIKRSFFFVVGGGGDTSCGLQVLVIPYTLLLKGGMVQTLLFTSQTYITGSWSFCLLTLFCTFDV
ncbi:hypothetical protein HOLleu_16535 [Holothuria leucospilota]|uniref:Uncharacterized protein n=1 Tax=Holothuria leucospilota TaxID=206669 RepID=A0A9Q1C5T4_HOLLE|nr:hypothetical protein HOLleu_16535 [Holothuria leucospilota]